MKEYKVVVSQSEAHIYIIKAKNKREARTTYCNGELHKTFGVEEYVVDIEEVSKWIKRSIIKNKSVEQLKWTI